MSNNSFAFINTRLQPDVKITEPGEPFQRLLPRGKTVETVFAALRTLFTGLKSGVNEIE